MSAEWQKYSVSGCSDNSSRFSDTCVPFSLVFNVAHIRDAIRIVEDETIRSSLIWDESKLNNSRTCVSWLSPNTWAPGSLYGNIMFEFDWCEIVAGKRLYWVEGMDGYSPAAYRILVTDKEYNNIEAVSPYDPRQGDGPLYFRDNTWYRNGRFNGEFMIDADLPLHLCKQIRFTDHHRNICSKDNHNCPDKGLISADAGARFLAIVIGRNMLNIKRLFLEENKEAININPDAKSALLTLMTTLMCDIEGGETLKEVKNTRVLMQAALIAYGNYNDNLAFRLINMYDSVGEISLNLYSVASEYFDLEIKSPW